MNRSLDTTEVAIAILRRSGRLLARLRRPDERLPGVWEFPGGKIREWETPEHAARREVREEMGVEATDLALRERIEHSYPGLSVRIHVFEGACAGEPMPPDGARWAWLTPAELAGLPVPEANRDLVARLASEG